MSAGAWSVQSVLRRLRAVQGAVPNWGSGSQSTTINGLAGYAHDARVVLAVGQVVLRAAAMGSGPRSGGPDDFMREEWLEDRDEARRAATEALDWAEEWVAWRQASGWAAQRMVSVGERPWAVRDGGGRDA